ncbi:MAG TPA: hypothetical protein VN624_05080 [Rhodanobacter sp.]|nr:hypothetical protein [Rhodanobacter sp.]
MDGYLGVGAQTNAQHGVERCAAQVAAFRVQRFRLARHLAASFPTFRPFDLFDFIPDTVAASRVNDAFPDSGSREKNRPRAGDEVCSRQGAAAVPAPRPPTVTSSFAHAIGRL